MDGRVRCLAQVVGKSILSEVINGHLAIEELLSHSGYGTKNRGI